MNITKSNRSRSYKTLNRNIQIEYYYTRLSEQGSIRLLRLMPHKRQKGTHKVLTLRGEGIYLYEALSYVWGSKENHQPIYIQSDNKSSNYLAAEIERGPNPYSYLLTRNNLRLLITIALLNVLYGLMLFASTKKITRKKGQQVQSIAKIYTRANRVIVRLGEVVDKSY
ncbi:unnamed protein product [Clonostachys rosea f. rosea IK726]|uniref:Heterokaryon incompatibility domain-containing protein n=2 Tax=Bionectria ochroleuca TaxID=29856 RepID=A0A0B7KNX5_BIOOC|nr:unnamed protein product [Clonostachys rosea f. rosea IK726]